MKRSIDLTQKRDFNKINDDNFFEAISRSLQLRMYGNKNLPWRINIRHVNNDDDLKDSEISYDDILITGNKIKRAETNFYRKIYRNVCDCCGKPLDYIPWKRKFGLCDKCNEINSQNKNNIPWKVKEQNKRICWR